MSTDQKKTELDKTWKRMLDIARVQQQENYECSAEWTRYSKAQYKYLKQNIGYAMFGPPTENAKDNVHYINADSEDDFVGAISYHPKAEAAIKIVYNQVLKFGKYWKDSYIYYGLIYNVTFPTRIELKEIVQSDSAEDKEKIQLFPTPIFKIIRKPEYTADGEIWYIDICGRVYKNWTNYIMNNTLPKCTMVLPKNGLYQYDPSYEITEEHSTVWLEVFESPACDTATAVLKGADIASNVVGAVGIGLGVASIFTPLAPVVVGAAVASSISGAWTIGRSAQTLIDKGSHEESLLDRNAFPAWLAIGGSAVGLAASGGSAILTAVTKNGGTVSKAAQFAYNTLLVSNIGVNGVGLSYQAYCLYEKYREGSEIRTVDAVFLATHLLFFANSVINIQFAAEVIESTQGKVLNDYRATLRSKRLRGQFNRAKRNAATNNTDKIAENAEVIQYINKKLELRAKNPNNTQNNQKTVETSKTHINACKGTPLYETIKINGIKLISPMAFVRILLKFDESHFQGNNSERSTSNSTEDEDATNMLLKLKNLLLTLLTKLSSGNDNRNVHIPDITKFDDTLNDMKYIKYAPDILGLIFKIAEALANESSRPECIHNTLHFTWKYIKESLRQTCSDAFCFRNKIVQNALNRMVLGLTDYIDEIVKQLLPAFEKYISKYLEMLNSYIRSGNTKNLEANKMQTSNAPDQNETLNIDGIRFTNPMKFVQILLEFDQNPSYENNSEKGTSCSTKDEAAEYMFLHLIEFLLILFKDLRSENVDKSVYVPEMTKFNNIFNDMKYLKNATEILFVTFRISTALAMDSSYLEYIYEAIHFVWNYVKESLKQTSSGIFCINDEETRNELNRMMTAFTDNKDEIVRELLPAFKEYIKVVKS